MPLQQPFVSQAPFFVQKDSCNLGVISSNFDFILKSERRVLGLKVAQTSGYEGTYLAGVSWRLLDASAFVAKLQWQSRQVRHPDHKPSPQDLPATSEYPFLLFASLLHLQALPQFPPTFFSIFSVQYEIPSLRANFHNSPEANFSNSNIIEAARKISPTAIVSSAKFNVTIDMWCRKDNPTMQIDTGFERLGLIGLTMNRTKGRLFFIVLGIDLRLLRKTKHRAGNLSVLANCSELLLQLVGNFLLYFGVEEDSYLP
ncbi:hypothetical protein Acr_15g0010360 [Actinidia rufa]|uniref:Uncharacterized protein n=1 Tax=Actinidia rufa TaxID=165716 RepID=A0A7J0FWX9_9ERIC|nr:hypothetical protein Acr_15g0010360 [Actinidia rufa]